MNIPFLVGGKGGGLYELRPGETPGKCVFFFLYIFYAGYRIHIYLLFKLSVLSWSLQGMNEQRKCTTTVVLILSIGRKLIIMRKINRKLIIMMDDI